MIWHNQSVA